MLKKNYTEIALEIQRIYIKDASFEAPNTPRVFQKKWHPEIKLDINTKSSNLEDKIYESVLRVTVTAIIEKKTAFLCEVHQAGIFFIPNIDGINKTYCLGVHCPYILFPYASEYITNQISRGTFPQLNLAPINFDKIFSNCMQKQNGTKTIKLTQEAS